jgi:hypothetical protein
MAFRIRDLMIAVLPPGAGGLGGGCGVSLGGCGGASFGGPCGITLPGCGVSFPGCGVTLIGDCGNDYTCKGCTNTCDAGCSRVQCSDYPTKEIPAQQFEDLRIAELLRLRAQMRIAIQERAVGGPIVGAPELAPRPEDIDQLEQHLQSALHELRQERERRAAASKESGSSNPEK